LSADPTNTDPESNTSVTANFENFTTWKNAEDGVIANQIGDVRFVNIKAVDNVRAGIEVSLTREIWDGYAQINKALIVGLSTNNAWEPAISFNQRGIITPRSDNFSVFDVSFYNFTNTGSVKKAAIGTCSRCEDPLATDSGARTVTFSGLSFNNCPNKVIYNTPYRDILYDLDGSLTGLESKTWATPFWPHNEQPEC